MQALVKDISWLRNSGRNVVLVSSGAIGAGMEALRMTRRPKDMAQIQMAAAVGQSRLMSRYDDMFRKYRCRVGQVLLTHDDFSRKVRTRNASRTIKSMLDHDVIPIVNENDVVAVEEIQAVQKLGDNDLLASLVCGLINAKLAIMLTTADGLREPGANGRTRRVKFIEKITRSTFDLVKGSDNEISTGGMASKLKAVDSISKQGCDAVIADGRKAGIIRSIVDGDNVGSFVLARKK